MASPRELTQNPLKKIWMPYSNGRPALHACQRGGGLVFQQEEGCLLALKLSLGRNFSADVLRIETEKYAMWACVCVPGHVSIHLGSWVYSKTGG
uniref:6-phosphofructo-2-kinase/fructose-2,6-biphosphatase 4 n=1 Tax=Macaca nemestrina TaxID=9545 RepID=A0A2K6CSN9_MACNE